MAELSDAARKALAYWPQIEEAAASRMTTQDLWQNLHDAAAELGRDTPGVSILGVNELRSLATTIQASAARLERQADSFAIDARHVGEAPWSRDPAERDALSIYQVRYQHTTVTPEGPETNWRTSIFYGQLPATAGELRAAIGEDANQLAAKYGHSHVDFGNLQVLAV